MAKPPKPPKRQMPPTIPPASNAPDPAVPGTTIPTTPPGPDETVVIVTTPLAPGATPPVPPAPPAPPVGNGGWPNPDTVGTFGAGDPFDHDDLGGPEGDGFERERLALEGTSSEQPQHPEADEPDRGLPEGEHGELIALLRDYDVIYHLAARRDARQIVIPEADWDRLKTLIGTEPPERGVCRVCGCTDAQACPMGCEWVDNTHTLCSNPRCFTARPPGLQLQRPSIVIEPYDEKAEVNVVTRTTTTEVQTVQR